MKCLTTTLTHRLPEEILQQIDQIVCKRAEAAHGLDSEQQLEDLLKKVRHILFFSGRMWIHRQTLVFFLPLGSTFAIPITSAWLHCRA